METVIRLLAGISVEQLVIALLILAVSYLFKLLNKLQYNYNALNTIVFSLDKHTKHNGVKTGNSQGDFMLDWDGIPETFNEPHARQIWHKMNQDRAHNVQKTDKEKDALIESYRRIVAKHDADKTTQKTTEE